MIADAEWSEELLEAAAARSSAWPEEALPPIIQTYCGFAEQEESYLVREWSMKAKAAYSKQLRPQVLAVLDSGDRTPLINPESRFPAPSRETIASTTFAYGLPAEDHLQQEDALALARQLRWNKYSLDAQTVTQEYSCYEYFDVTEPDRPLWRFLYCPDFL